MIDTVTSSGVGVDVAVVVVEVGGVAVGAAVVARGEATGPVADAVAAPLNISASTSAPAPAAPVTAANSPAPARPTRRPFNGRFVVVCIDLPLSGRMLPGRVR
ncbi:MAG TPA: hypothetical protein VFT68_16965 [Lapillicoccus sp.]|nr:hypothetical protein [Lapillicoccus sp.]